MRPVRWQTPDGRLARQAGGRTHHCASAVDSRRPATACTGRGDDDVSTIEFGLYLPHRAWHFTCTRHRVAPVEIRDTRQTDDDRDQVAVPPVS